MLINFYNKNAPVAHFKIGWGNGKFTPVFELKAGDMGAFDLSMIWCLREGTECCAYAWTDGPLKCNEAHICFQYIKGEELDNTFYFSIDPHSRTCTFNTGDFVFEF